MTADEYFDSHIPHRLNLLIAFRTRYAGKQSALSLDPEAYRDLYRCAKDICFMMTRFFCGELGIYFDEETKQMKPLPKPKKGKKAKLWKGRYGNTQADVPQLRGDPRYADLCQMYRATNHAVAHMNHPGVNHSFQHAADDQRMVAVVDWLESLIAKHIYSDAGRGRDLAHSMSLPNNVMT